MMIDQLVEKFISDLNALKKDHKDPDGSSCVELVDKILQFIAINGNVPVKMLAPQLNLSTGAI